MRHSALVRFSALLGASVVTMGLSGAVAGAAPANDGPAQLDADRLPAELVAAVQRDLKLSPQEYLDRAAAAQQLRSYADDFRRQNPADFAGAWMGDDGVPVVAVTTTEAAARVADDGFRSRQSPVSADSLDASLAEFGRWVSALPREVSSQINSAAVDVLQGKVVVDIANSPVGRALNLPTAIANLQVVLSPPAPAPGGAPAVTGGDDYVTSSEDLATAPAENIEICSFGFAATDGAGRPVSLSAGHCDPGPGPDGNARVYLPSGADVRASTPVGRFDRSAVGGPAGLDWSVIALDDAGVAAGLDRPSVRGAGGTTLEVTGTAAPVIGAPVCKSGQASSFTCGVVAADQVETQLILGDGSEATIRGFASTACTLAGDSGGAIVTGTLALGITSGSNSGGAPSCGEANLALAQYGGTASLGIPIRAVAAESGTTVRTS
ncbi:S1 family peptidase [Rhodococcoides corynebacterioides]|uniref:S1 family peptidase n=1 Tax=Rhodococcoides corynebacterioides TaxID=53972 RepID=UPI000A801B46|nr:S1 family peptidase [Rhodococcus corynebacterioides]